MTKTVAGCVLLASLIIITSCMGGAKDRDGYTYKIVKIGNQVWMAENLNVSRFKNGDTVPEVKSSAEWEFLGKQGKPAWCIQQNDPENGKKYGKLYNWYAVNDPRGLAPKGWHVPSDEEWTSLTTYLGGEVFAAFKLRTTSLSETPGETGNSGFKGLPAGACTSNGSFYGLGSHTFWWSSTEVTSSSAWIRMLNYLYGSFNSLNYNKNYGFSVRCLKN